jgi:hypothetical protein
MQILNKLVNSEIIEVISGGSNGSIIVLKLSNPQKHEFSLFIYCTWRLETETEVLTGSNECPSGNLLYESQLLLNDKIVFVQQNIFNDIIIKFKSKKKLNIFCDITPKCDPKYYTKNWTICNITENKCYSAGLNKEIHASVYE